MYIIKIAIIHHGHFFSRKVNIFDNWRHASGSHGDTDHSWGQDKDEGGPGRGVLHYLLHVKYRGLSELGAQVVNDEGGGTEGHPIWAQRAHQQHSLEFITGVVPFT